ncbi:uroporphyrinogen-III C-methyltransferase [Shewanella pneumatophori]|uniref:uroporphyrinogen-III C-methyltransferase n=1 Tax=Shewanella pneumatophori TaxID=314092 RepID=A0A9X1Z7Q9_9GAMM|nr:uroporphyrinogen-III C-methyltransferase [Shewanella pneumatophori]MCL1137024.1 uroporphyrinogen-III C-methyltransferase [Shewanella pneumatophori]
MMQGIEFIKQVLFKSLNNIKFINSETVEEFSAQQLTTSQLSGQLNIDELCSLKRTGVESTNTETRIQQLKQLALQCFKSSEQNKLINKQYQIVKIVGAGCGDIELLTLKAAKVITEADVIVYDNLVCAEILQLAATHCRLIYMGKRFAQKSRTQDEINQSLYHLAISGVKVVRLKGGDPNVFGRGGEEALFLAKRGVKSEFIAGVTAALGCAASSGIPLTHRKVARSVTFVTGRTCDNKKEQAVIDEWQGLLSANSTLVFYMGKEKALDIATGLMLAGAEGCLPVAFITNGARQSQTIKFSRVDQMAQDALSIKQTGPTLIIVGEVVSIGAELEHCLAFCSQSIAANECVYG